MDSHSHNSFVDLDDDGDVKCDDYVLSDESGHSEHNEEQNGEDLKETDTNYRNIMDLTGDEIRGLEFGSEGGGCQFYETYAKFHDFVVRKDDVKRDFNGKIIMRQLVCNREGLRNKKYFMMEDRTRDPQPLTRTNCQAKIRIYLDYRSSKWKVSSFEESHNHELTPAQYVHLMPAYRVMTDADKAQVDHLHSFGVRTCHIMGYLVS